jgi:hypothetical protein
LAKFLQKQCLKKKIMFTTRKQLYRKSGKKGVDRFEFLQELVNEFYQSNSLGMFHL